MLGGPYLYVSQPLATERFMFLVGAIHDRNLSTKPCKAVAAPENQLVSWLRPLSDARALCLYNQVPEDKKKVLREYQMYTPVQA